jgi:hypothetical protein
MTGRAGDFYKNLTWNSLQLQQITVLDVAAQTKWEHVRLDLHGIRREWPCHHSFCLGRFLLRRRARSLRFNNLRRHRLRHICCLWFLRTQYHHPLAVFFFSLLFYMMQRKKRKKNTRALVNRVALCLLHSNYSCYNPNKKKNEFSLYFSRESEQSIPLVQHVEMVFLRGAHP